MQRLSGTGGRNGRFACDCHVLRSWAGFCGRVGGSGGLYRAGGGSFLLLRACGYCCLGLVSWGRAGHVSAKFEMFLIFSNSLRIFLSRLTTPEAIYKPSLLY